MKKVFVLTIQKFYVESGIHHQMANNNTVIAVCNSRVKAQRLMDEHAYEWRNAGYYVQNTNNSIIASSLGMPYFAITMNETTIIK